MFSKAGLEPARDCDLLVDRTRQSQRPPKDQTRDFQGLRHVRERKYWSLRAHMSWKLSRASTRGFNLPEAWSYKRDMSSKPVSCWKLTFKKIRNWRRPRYLRLDSPRK
ncbi:hypothetical protein J6590_042651 [Homalodisca vitripennis]|nr:hypothetical protein J6590_042651 [Homalodisca vitripennis]